ncbi:transglutaminase-like domain-containing protein, partial [Patescibacteria group bacterium]|nr:transglutaminase-like domain-containing protein [Patescibacteria group bacterium]
MFKVKIFTPVLKFFLFSSLILAITFPTNARCADFTTSYDMFYKFDESGKAEVIQDVNLTNHTVDRYIADYTLTSTAQEIEGVTAYDNSGTLETLIEKQSGAQTIKVFLGQKTAGLNTQTAWTLKYQIPEMATRKGRIWELRLPGLEHSTPIENLEINLDIPESFGPPQYLIPSPISTVKNEGRLVYTFNQESIKNQGLSGAFGDYQLFSFSLTYHLENPLDIEALTEIALLPDVRPLQKVYLKTLNPEPEELTVDDDGNELASYRLKPQEKLTVIYEGQVETSLNTENKNLVENTAFDQLHARYTKPDRYWETNHESIQNIVNDQINESMTSREQAQKLYEFTVSNLTYEPTRFDQEVQRLGAVEVLKQKDNAVCMEYTDLLITLLRAAGIPARELNGFAYSPDAIQESTEDVLHSWVQFYDADIKRWVQIDPTWESTSGRDYFNQLDTDRVIFVIKGLDSERPYPAGCYKNKEEAEQKDVNIEFAERRESGTVPFALWKDEFERKHESKNL